MKTKIKVLAACVALATLGLSASSNTLSSPSVPGPAPRGPLKVVATLPDLADLLEEIGGKRVSVTTLTRGRENLHTVMARPSHLVAMNRADCFVQVGLSLEAAFVPGLLQGARNKRILPGAPGFVNVSDGWEAIGVPAVVSRLGGDLHPQGNPHMNLDPRAGAHMAGVIVAALVRLDPGGRAEYERRHAAYVERLAAAQTRWRELLGDVAGGKLVVYHMEFDYLARSAGLEIVATIEVKPGIPPTPNHLAAVIAQMRAEEVHVIAIAPWSAGKNVERVAEATGARIVVLPNQVDGAPGAETWIEMMDLMHRRLGEAFAAAPQEQER